MRYNTILDEYDGGVILMRRRLRARSRMRRYETIKRGKGAPKPGERVMALVARMNVAQWAGEGAWLQRRVGGRITAHRLWVNDRRADEQGMQ